MHFVLNFCCFSAQLCEPPAPASNQSPNPNNPAEYCSTIPPLQQAEASGVLSSPPPTVMVPVGVLKQSGSEGTAPHGSNKILWTFSHCFFLGNLIFLCGFLVVFFFLTFRVHIPGAAEGVVRWRGPTKRRRGRVPQAPDFQPASLPVTGHLEQILRFWILWGTPGTENIQPRLMLLG